MRGKERNQGEWFTDGWGSQNEMVEESKRVRAPRNEMEEAPMVVTTALNETKEDNSVKIID